MELFNTLTRRKEEFKPLKDKKVGLYTCGITSYDYAHIGNMRTYVLEDILRRYLEWKDFKVNHVMNVTDVGHLTSDADTGEDKIEVGAKREGKSAWEIADFYTKYFLECMKLLGNEMPTVLCKATDHIKEQLDLIKTLEKKGFTYTTKDGVYFDTSKLKDYGKLGNLDIEGLKAGARIEVGEKKHPTDFALWKFSLKDQKRQMEWRSPWGIGFPGWHIECSAMAMKYLGETFDMHCGGIDHIPVHHTNEIAQSEAATGRTFVNYWIHMEHLMVNGEKMSKSKKNYYTLTDLIEKGYDPRAIRLFFLMSHYKSQQNLTMEALDAAKKGLERIDDFMHNLGLQNGKNNKEVDPIVKAFLREWEVLMDNDLNTPEALALMFEFIKSINKEMEKGMSKKDAKSVMGSMKGIDEVFAILHEEKGIPKEAKELIKRRERARKEKNYAESDSLRKQLEEVGIEIKDGKEKSYYRMRA